MLTCDRPELADRAVQCFRAQTYEPRWMLEFDTGKFTVHSHFCDGDTRRKAISFGELIVNHEPSESRTIGDLRNAANIMALEQFSPDIIVHFDDDDWSHPNRIAEQVALLQASGADAVGYNEMLFWRDHCEQQKGAWLFNGSTIIGTSLCYWRAAWEKRPFEATSYGEDTNWLRGVKKQGVRAFHVDPADAQWVRPGEDPRMVARIHKSNTSKAYDMKSMLAAPRQWKRVPEWDQFCKSVMEC